jgi:hypothetical protein
MLKPISPTYDPDFDDFSFKYFDKGKDIRIHYYG